MDKHVLRQQVLDRLAEDLLQAEQALQAAHEAATHEENIAENKYDTLGLEAAYLATGQARRAEAIRQAMAVWRQFRPGPYDASKAPLHRILDGVVRVRLELHRAICAHGSPPCSRSYRMAECTSSFRGFIRSSIGSHSSKWIDVFYRPSS